MNIDYNETLTKDELTEKRFETILVKFLLEEPFFASIIRSVRKERVSFIPTAGVGYQDTSIILYWNPEFLSGLNIYQIFGLLKHECYHLIFRHLTSRKQKPHLHWNIATDLAINSIIPERELPEGGLIPGKPLTFKGDTSHLPEDFIQKRSKLSDFIQSLPRGRSSEWYMDKIREDSDIGDTIDEVMGDPSSCAGNGPAGDGDKEGDGKSSPCNGAGGSGAGFDYHFDTEGMSQGERDMIDAKLNEIIKEAANRADRTRGWGSCSSSVQNRIRATIYGGVNWEDVLRYFCGSKLRANKSRTFKKINRKYPYQHPGRKISHTSHIAIYIDQSGSVSDADLVLLFSTLNKLAKKTSFTIFHFDTQVDENSRYLWKKNKMIDKPYRTRYGGTCFDCVEDYHRKVQHQFDVHIVCTEGEAPKPKICKSKRCWLILPGAGGTAFTPDKRDVVINMKRDR